MLQQRRTAVQLDGDRARATVALIRAIGGSWGEGGKDGVQDAGKGGEAAPAPALPAPAGGSLARVGGMGPARWGVGRGHLPGFELALGWRKGWHWRRISRLFRCRL